MVAWTLSPHPHAEAAEKASGFKVGTVKAAADVSGVRVGAGGLRYPLLRFQWSAGVSVCTKAREKKHHPSTASPGPHLPSSAHVDPENSV